MDEGRERESLTDRWINDQGARFGWQIERTLHKWMEIRRPVVEGWRERRMMNRESGGAITSFCVKDGCSILLRISVCYASGPGVRN